MTTVSCVRCKSIRVGGQRCKRNTCVRKDYCWQHLRIELGVDVRPSTLRGGGKGLFAYKTFPNRSNVASYSVQLALVPVAEAKDSQYAVAWRRGKVVDAKSTQHSVGRYANTCRGVDKRRKKCKGNNVKMSRDFTRRNISLKADQTDQKGSGDLQHIRCGLSHCSLGGPRFRFFCGVSSRADLVSSDDSSIVVIS
jgi:hypothetical protein